MWNSQQEERLMELMESQPERPIDFFDGMLDNRSQCDFFRQNFEPRNQKLFEKPIDQGQPIICSEKFEIKQEEIEAQKVIRIQKEKGKLEQITEIKQIFFKSQTDQEIKLNKIRVKNSQKNKRTTRCTSKPDSEEVLQLNDEIHLHSIVADCACENEQNLSQSKKIEKFKKKIDKHIFKKENHFKKSFKISFPKKIVEMFINHYEEYFDEDSDILKYNHELKQRLKQNKKNDYTFDKEVCQILGQNKQMQAEFSRKISFANRRVFSRIVRQTMKEEVIMRDKISQNRELYMIQLKVYALRCRSHRLSKKGTFK